MDKQQRREAFAKRFIAALEREQKAELSDGELVKRLARHGVSVTPATVGNWRNAKHMPKLEQMEGVARLLNMDPGALAFGGPRISEPPKLYAAADSQAHALIERIALLDAKERAVLTDLVALLESRRVRAPGKRRKT
ncbi:hypothetical protein [Thermomonas sp. LB-4]|jgi:transcriptional regulator with XRE-family HTH domain|uniref:hypothetical protein n=1 Tax=Thermomonas sp. LB-4 TaxID=3102790 RepID=UPI002ED94065